MMLARVRAAGFLDVDWDNRWRAITKASRRASATN
jgi:hypothetical protein